MQITIGRVPGELTKPQVADGSTVAQALAAASLTLSSGESVNVNGQVLSSDALATTVLAANATVLLTRQVKGN